MKQWFSRLATIEAVTVDDDVATTKKIHTLKRILIRNNQDAMAYMMSLQNCPGTWIGPFDNTLIDSLIENVADGCNPKSKRCIDRLLRKPINSWIYDGVCVRQKLFDSESSPYGAFPNKELCLTYGCTLPVLECDN
jgi:hypothetical protein